MKSAAQCWASLIEQFGVCHMGPERAQLQQLKLAMQRPCLPGSPVSI